MLTALPSVSGALLRVPYSFMVPIFGGRRWTAFSTGILIIPCVWLGLPCRIPPRLIASSSSSLCCAALLARTSLPVWRNISFFFPKQKQGGALGLNGGLGNMGVSVMQLVRSAGGITVDFRSIWQPGVKQPDGTELYLANASWVWVPFLAIFTIAAWFGMNDLATSKASIKEQLPVLKRGHLWIMSLLYLATFGSFIGFSAGFAMLSKNAVPGCSDSAIRFLRAVYWCAGAVLQVVHYLTVWAELVSHW